MIARPFRSALTAVLALAVTSGLAQAAPSSAPSPVVARFVVLGANGARMTRVLTTAPTCPVLDAFGSDGRKQTLSMSVRQPAGVVPARGHSEVGSLGKPAAFPVTACEATVPADVIRIQNDGFTLPLPPSRIDRIVVIGDTGCRLKQSEKAYQDCNSPSAYPFARIAQAAAAWKPDLVVHVGDYLYRESPCPDDHPGCAGSPDGYGWDAWNADLFTPGAPLLKAAAWVAVRGNHEDCARAGVGWFRLLDPHPSTPGRDCLDPAEDGEADYTAPYAVPIGGGAQVIVLDLTAVGEKPLAPGSRRAAQVAETYDAMAALSQGVPYSFVANHKPILGFGATEANGTSQLRPGNLGPQAVLTAKSPNLFPETVQVLLSGHIHIWEQLSFATPHPSQFVTGFSGTLEDVPNIPEYPGAGDTPVAGAVLEHFSVWNGQFGYMTLERQATDRWAATVHDADGHVVRRCEIEGRHSRC
jgi:hypothetical protein